MHLLHSVKVTEIDLELRDFKVSVSVISDLELKVLLLLPELTLLNDIQALLSVPYRANVLVCFFAQLPGISGVTDNALFR